MASIISVKNVSKTYGAGVKALDDVSLEIEEGEILALLGPNGAGKTTLISTICGLVTVSRGSITVGGHDIVRDFRAARDLIGLVPQEITIEPFEKVIRTTQFSRGLFGKPPDEAYIEKVLKSLSLWEKRDSANRELSGGMRRRVLIAKALSHQPRILFLDEPTAGVDVSLRKDMWDMVRELRADGVTIILTTHYIEEAEEMADRIAVINDGKVMLVEEKDNLIKQMGHKELRLDLSERLTALPASLAEFDLRLNENGTKLTYEYDTKAERTGITRLLAGLSENGVTFTDLDTEQSSLEQIFLRLVEDAA